MTEVAKDDAITASSPSSTLIDSASEEHPDVARLVRLAAGAAGCTTSAVYRLVGERNHQLVHALDGAPLFEEVAEMVVGEVAESGRRRFVVDDRDDGSPIFVAAVPVFGLRGDVIAVLTVGERARRTATPGLWSALEDLAQFAQPLFEAEDGTAYAAERAERLMSGVVSTIQQINDGTTTAPDVIRYVIRESVSLTQAFGACVGLIEDGAVHVVAASEDVTEINDAVLSLDNRYIGQCIAAGRAVLCRDVDRELPEDMPWCRRLGARSLVNVPLNYRGKTVGMLAAFGRRPNAFRPSDVRALDQLAALIAMSVERLHAQEVLRDTQDRYAALFERTAEAIAFVDPANQRVLDANPAFRELLGYDADAVKTLTVADFAHDTAGEMSALIGQSADDDVTTSNRTWLAKDGRKVHVQTTVSVIRQDGKDVIFIVARDVTSQVETDRVRRRAERKYRDLFERANVPILIFRTDDEVILEANRSAVILYGFERDELIGQSLKDLTQNPARGEEEIRQILSQGGAQNFETVHRRKDGSTVSMLVSCSLIEYDGAPAILMFGRDISDRLRAERLLTESEARFRAVAEQALDLIGIFDRRARLRYIVGPIFETLGYAPSQIRAFDVFEHIHEDDLPLVRRHFLSLLRMPEHVITADFRFRRSDGAWAHLSLKARNLLDLPGVNGILVSIRDVSERKAFEVELVEAKERAEEMVKLKNAFLANMSHEIRTPLTGILGFADVLARELEGEHREFVTLIQEGGRRLSETLNSVLDLARLEAGGFKPVLESVDAVEVVGSGVGLFRSIADRKNLSLTFDRPDAPIQVVADRGGLTRVIQNLLSNALKFTSEGSVSVQLTAEDDQVVISVADTGEGIDEAFMPDIFEEFKQESTGLSRNHEGAGLGLTITKRLVDLMDGQISVESTKGEGSVFTVILPMGVSAQPILNPTHDPDRTLEGRRVLVVEDNVFTRLLVERLLRDSYIVTTVASADEAFALATEKAFDVVLMDINLGEEVDGVDVMRQFKRDQTAGNVPMVALTAYAMPEDRDRFLEAGFDHYLSKPFTKEDLRRTIVEAMGS